VVGLIMPIFGGVNSAHAIFFAALAALASFLTADLVVYPRYGNLPAMAVDVVISAVILVEFNYLFHFAVPVHAYVITLALLAGGEWYFHRYLSNVMFKRRRR
jgi:hypothetical protein